MKKEVTRVALLVAALAALAFNALDAAEPTVVRKPLALDSIQNLERVEPTSSP